MVTTGQDTEGVIRRYVDALNARDLEEFSSTLHDDVVVHGLLGSEGDVKGRDAYVETMKGWLNAFSPASLQVEESISEGDMAAVRWILTGTQVEALGPIPATGKDVRFEAIAMFRLAGDKIAEKWYRADDLGMLRQLGVAP
jgi:steroid delta-isomerase-like uncharacterized protein